MNITQRAYLAGLIDGEGCICISKNHPVDRRGKIPRTHVQYNLELTVTNTNPLIISWLKKYGRGRRIAKSRYRFKPQWKTAYNWRATSRQHLELTLEEVVPFLQAKKKQASIALDFIRIGDTSNPAKREKLYQKMRVLNRRGMFSVKDFPIKIVNT
jgi:hypothetical protein